MDIKRASISQILAHMDKEEITLLVGPRQAGKTTLMQMIRDYLERLGQKTLFMSLDFEIDSVYFRSQQSLIERLHLEFGKQRAFVFIDEIQHKQDAGLFLKGLYDMKLPYKFICSGSGSLELKEKIHESLVGRKRVFEINTLSLSEVVNFKTEYSYEDRLNEYFAVVPEAKNLLLEYLNFGGYPRVTLEQTLEEKTLIIDEIFRSYIEKDIAYLLRLERIDALKDLIKILASQIGELINLSEISSTTTLSLPTLKNYLSYLEKTFVIKKVTPFFKNTRKEITKSPIYYFYDIGLRNYILGQFGKIQALSDMGFLFQNLVFNILRQIFPLADIYFWRTTDKAEVDVVLELQGRILPVEVKFKNLRNEKIGRSLKSFIQKYQPTESWIVNLSHKSEVKVSDTVVKFIPIGELLKNAQP